jgi:regulator of RNase E activity RraA
MTVRTAELVERLLGIDVSALCDADKTLPVVDPAVRALLPDVRIAGPALTVLAEADHLPVFAALDVARPGDVLVVATGGAGVAVSGELFATEAVRRGVAGLVVDGYVRDLQGLRRAGLPVFARGTTPMSGTVRSRAPLGRPIVCGGVAVSPGDVVFADDDGVVIAPPEQVVAALDAGEAIARAERAMLERVRAGSASLHELTTFREHLAALDAGQDSALAFTVDA